LKINFNVWNLGLSGGNRVIFDLSNALVDLGHKVTITHLLDESRYAWWAPNPLKAEVINCNYSGLQKLLVKAKNKLLLGSEINSLQSFLAKKIPLCDYNIATYCLTAQPTVASRKGKGAYLVQHYEPLFFARNSPCWLAAKESYLYGLPMLCVSEWLAQKVSGVNIGNGINLAKFKCLPIEKEPCTVMFSRRQASWKNTVFFDAVKNTLESLGFTFILSNEDLSDADLVKAYNRAEVFLNLSDKEGFGFQPLEAMACGCKIVSTSCSEYLNDGENCVLLNSLSQQEIASKISKVIGDNLLCQKILKNGLKTAQKFDFNLVVKRFLEALN
jgi:hypothetical protein